MLFGGEAGYAHVDPHLAVGLDEEVDGAGGGAHRDLGLGRQPLVAHEAGEAAGAVAALFHLGAVGVEDAVVKVGAGQAWGLHQQDLVAADAETAIRQEAALVRVQVYPLAHAVKDHKVVAQALHLGESEFHDAVQPGRRPETVR
jgi:hypothetical protein